MDTHKALSPIVIDDLPTERHSLRVAVVTETYPPDVNGAALTLQRVVEGLRTRGHAIQLVRLRQDAQDAAAAGERFDEVLMRGMPIPRYPHLKMGLPCRRALVSRWSLRRPDVVHIATEGLLGWSALQAATRLKLPVCSEFRTNFHAYSRHYDLGWLHKPILGYLRKFHNRSTVTMVPTDGLRRELQGQGFHRLAVVARGVDTQLFSPSRRCNALREKWGAGADSTVALCVGRLAAEKNLGTAVDAFEAMRRVNPKVRFVMVGDGPMRAALEARCPDIVFAGVRTGEDLAQHYASADLFVFPSMTETWGNVTGEAMASGLAVLAFGYAAAAQLIQSGDNGTLVPFGDDSTFRVEAAHLASHPARLRSLGANARTAMMDRGWHSIVGDVESMYLHAMTHAFLPRARALLAQAADA